jgi:hypothetical protein
VPARDFDGFAKLGAFEHVEADDLLLRRGERPVK